jgi:hypothetical protein
MKRFLLLLAVISLSAAMVGCGSQATSNPGVDVTGNWNVIVTQNGQSTPSFTFGLAFTKNTTNIYGSEIAYTGGTPYNIGCINTGTGKITATGNTNGGSVITLVISDPTTSSSFTFSGQADASVTEINGSYNATFGANGSNAACPAESGTIVFTKQ